MSSADGYSGTDIPDDLRVRSVDEPDRESARDVQDPHEWEDDEPSVFERVFPETTGQRLGTAAILLVLGGLAYYLVPIFYRPLTSPWTIAALLFLGYSGGLYLKGRQDGIETYVDLDKSIVYYGHDADARLGEDGGLEGSETVFSPLKNLGYAGLRKAFLTLDDLPFATGKLRNKRGDDERPVRDRLNRSTVTIDSDNFGTVHVTHAADMEYDSYGQHTDRYAQPPRTIDEDVAEAFRMQHQELHHDLQRFRQQLELLEESNEQLRSLRDSQTIPQLEQVMDTMQDFQEVLDSHTRDKRRTNGHDKRREIQQKAEEEYPR